MDDLLVVVFAELRHKIGEPAALDASDLVCTVVGQPSCDRLAILVADDNCITDAEISRCADDACRKKAAPTVAQSSAGAFIDGHLPFGEATESYPPLPAAGLCGAGAGSAAALSMALLFVGKGRRALRRRG